MEVAKLAAPPNLEVRFVSCNESAIKRWLSSELEETVFSLTHELFMTKHHTVIMNTSGFQNVGEGNKSLNAMSPLRTDPLLRINKSLIPSGQILYQPAPLETITAAALYCRI